MSDHIEICADGIFVHKWNSKKRVMVRKRAKKLTICTHLRSVCEIAPGTTLGQIFDAVDKYKFLKLVIAQYSWCSAIEEFHAQAKEPMRKEGECDEITHLEIYWHVETESFTEKIKHPGGLRERIQAVDFEVSPDFHGIGPCKEGEDHRGNGLEYYSVSYTPMYELVDLPVVLKKEFNVYTPWDSNQPKKKSEKILTSKREFSLLEVLDAIYWDISFMGGPADNKAFIEDMSQRVEEIKAGEVPMIPIEQVGKRLGFETPNPDEPEDDEKKMKVVLHPDVARFFGVNPDEIPLDDKEIIRPDEHDVDSE